MYFQEQTTFRVSVVQFKSGKESKAAIIYPTEWSLARHTLFKHLSNDHFSQELLGFVKLLHDVD